MPDPPRAYLLRLVARHLRRAGAVSPERLTAPAFGAAPDPFL